jgi:imidazoleglycerol-phosphate dehydratase
MREATIHRKTRETEIELTLVLDGSGRSDIETPVGFLSHELEVLARHSLADLRVRARGDTHVDDHHTVEDIGIALGEALGAALGDKRGISRFGEATVPLDETLAQAVVDLSGRAAFVWNVKLPKAKVGTFDVELAREFFQALAMNARMNLHVTLLYGENLHHQLEAIFKAVARALRAASSLDPRLGGEVPSSKGVL